MYSQTSKSVCRKNTELAKTIITINEGLINPGLK